MGRTMTATLRPSDIARKLDGVLRYSRVWEDHRLLEQGLGVSPDGEYLVVASAGCNVLNLLLHEPGRIVALDLNRAQTALVELKLAGVRRLGRHELLELLGIVAGDPIAHYETVRPLLQPAARDWWDANTELLARGVDGAGRLDRFIAVFQREHVARIHAPALIDRLFTLRSPAERRRFVDDELLTPDFEQAFRAYFTRESIAAGGRHPDQFRYVTDGDVAARLLDRFRWVCTSLPARGNFYLERILRGPWCPHLSLPPYLASGSYDRLRALLPRVAVVTGDIETYLATRRAPPLAGAGLSDIFEYMTPAAAASLFARLAAAVRPAGRLAYWNFLVPRCSPRSMRDRLRPLRGLSAALARQDRAWFYHAFHVEEVQP
jgi:S-adenosylmethionine-diacylglycerol 3-amino-3-carboxypropyl transferase